MNELTHMSADPETRAKYDARIEGINRIYADQKLKISKFSVDIAYKNFQYNKIL